MNFELLDAWFGYQLSHMFERYTGRRDRLAALDIMQVRRMPRIVNVVPEIPEEDPVRGSLNYVTRAELSTVYDGLSNLLDYETYVPMRPHWEEQEIVRRPQIEIDRTCARGYNVVRLHVGNIPWTTHYIAGSDCGLILSDVILFHQAWAWLAAVGHIIGQTPLDDFLGYSIYNQLNRARHDMNFSNRGFGAKSFDIQYRQRRLRVMHNSVVVRWELEYDLGSGAVAFDGSDSTLVHAQEYLYGKL